MSTMTGTESPEHRYYPVFLDLAGRLCAVVGGGAVAEEKVEGLLAAGARVRLIAAAPSATLRRLIARRRYLDRVEHVARPYAIGDLAGTFLVLAERIDPATDRAVFAEAEARGIPVNVQDDTRHCSFIAPSVVRRGDLAVAISTAGKAPVLAVRLRQQLEAALGPEHARFLDIAGRLRRPLLERIPDFETRKELWYRLVDSDVLERLAHGDDDGALARVLEIMPVEPEAA